jgi:hypothetical protein
MEKINPLGYITDTDPVPEEIMDASGWFATEYMTVEWDGLSPTNYLEWYMAQGWTIYNRETWYEWDPVVSLNVGHARAYLKRRKIQSEKVLTDMIAEFTAAYNEGRSINDQRYDEIVLIFNACLDQTETLITAAEVGLDAFGAAAALVLDPMASDFAEYKAAATIALSMHEASANAMKALADDVDARAAELAAMYLTLDSSAAELITRAGDLDTSATELSGVLVSILATASDVTDSSSELDDLSGGIDALSDELDAAASELETLVNGLDSIDGNLDGFAAKLSDFVAELNTSASDLGTLAEKLTGFDSELPAADTNLSTDINAELTRFDAATDGLAEGFSDFEAESETALNAYGDSIRTQINTRFDNQLTAAKRDMVSRGLYNAVLYASVTAGVERERSVALTDLEDKITQQRIAIRTGTYDRQSRIKQQELDAKARRVAITASLHDQLRTFRDQKVRVQEHGLRLHEQGLGVHRHRVTVQEHGLRVNSQQMQVHAQRAALHDQGLKIHSLRVRIHDQGMRLQEQGMKVTSQKLALTEHRLRVNDQGLKIHNQRLALNDQGLKVLASRLRVHEQELRMIDQKSTILRADMEARARTVAILGQHYDQSLTFRIKSVEAKARVEEQIRKGKLDMLGVRNVILTAMLGFMERRTDDYPGLDGLADLAAKIGYSESGSTVSAP